MSNEETLPAVMRKLDRLSEQLGSLETRAAALGAGTLDRNTALDLIRQFYRGLEKHINKRFLLAEDRDRERFASVTGMPGPIPNSASMSSVGAIDPAFQAKVRSDPAGGSDGPGRETL